MATILLSAAGAAIGGSVGGSVLGLSMTAVGRFAGAGIGRMIDQRLMGQGSDVVETGRVDRIRLTGAGEGAPIARVHGRMRVGAHVIWATEFREHVSETQTETRGGGKGAPSRTSTTRAYHYSLSLALALCEGEIAAVGRVWADGVEIPLSDLDMRVYRGTRDQQPDPLLEAVEGVGSVPAYRGTAYVVIENLSLEPFGNRMPQFSFEVVRPTLDQTGLANTLRGVAMIPGTGEYAYATQPVPMNYADSTLGPAAEIGGVRALANVNSPSEEPDFNTALRQLRDEVPGCAAVSLIVSWFGDDLRCGTCTIRPKVEQTEHDGATMPWSVSGLARSAASTLPREDGRPVYGGTPDDSSIVQAIRRMTGQGLAVMYYPFILMDQMAGNGRTDPWTSAVDQPPLPWRGRITLSAAPGRPGSPDGTAQADAEVDAFFGTARAADFAVGDGTVGYSGPEDWRYGRFILHQAALCAAAGGVDSFCIGSEMRGLTQIRGASRFRAVEALRTLAAECRALLGPQVKIGYAADWSEYFGYHPQHSPGDAYFHLDPLWADPEIDFIGIDNYMPLSDWRDGTDHADADWGSIYELDYLKANVEGGEGYDWYYASEADRATQTRTPVTDGDGEPWVWRYKDLRNWWQNPHHDRIDGVRQPVPTAWQPRSKPVWFTEFGCAAIDKGTNQPNKFLDPKSSESRLPHFSNGLRDELIQHQYLRAMIEHWTDPANNPLSPVYGGRMLDMERAFVWAWDARPYPWFPGNEALWSDGPNYRRGHWINGRVSGRTLADVAAEICARAGLPAVDTSKLHGFVRGYAIPDTGDARRALQPLMLAYGFDAIERDGTLVLRMRDRVEPVDLTEDAFAVSEDIDGALSATRDGEADMAGRVRLRFVLADADHQVVAEETVLPDARGHAVSESEVALALTRGEGRQTVERWLAEARVSRDTMRFALPASRLDLGAGDVVRLSSAAGPTLARIERVEVTDRQILDAVRLEPDVFEPARYAEEAAPLRPFTPAVSVASLFMDLPLLTGDEVPQAPHIALNADPWPGSVALYHSSIDADYRLSDVFGARSVIGVTETDLAPAPPGRIDHGAPLLVRLFSGGLQSVSDAQLLAGANAIAIGDGTPDTWEIVQFRDAQLVGEGRWALSHRLRGQAGSDGVMPAVWPAGSIVVRLDGRPRQIPLGSAERGIARHYRIGPARRGYDDPSYRHVEAAFRGNGLRPYRPAHLAATAFSEESGLGFDFNWIRRTRIDGDGWDGIEVPLGEEAERYLLRVESGGVLRREVQVTETAWRYRGVDRVGDGITGPFDLRVAQVSERYGPGPFARIALEP